ncbi:MAG: uroporphyrinogen-III synthase [Bacteroidales bacterium]|nr:uroporphyrinogen-III synthase [Bacteroidales bacterium]
MTRIKKILVSQPKPESDKSPFFELAEKNNVKIDFRPFIQVEGVSVKEFRASRVDLLLHSAVIFTSKHAIDHYFRMAEELRLTIPDTMKYFCISESTAYYLQKYIIYRKRKIFFSANGQFPDLMDSILKHKDENYLVPLSNTHKEEIPAALKNHGIKFTQATLYKTVSSDLSDLAEVNYDILVFYSPSGIKSLFQNFPDFKQNETKIATWGTKTAKAVQEAGLRLDIAAPMPDTPSMTMAIEKFIKDFNKNGKK